MARRKWTLSENGHGRCARCRCRARQCLAVHSRRPLRLAFADDTRAADVRVARAQAALAGWPKDTVSDDPAAAQQTIPLMLQATLFFFPPRYTPPIRTPRFFLTTNAYFKVELRRLAEPMSANYLLSYSVSTRFASLQPLPHDPVLIDPKPRHKGSVAAFACRCLGSSMAFRRWAMVITHFLLMPPSSIRQDRNLHLLATGRAELARTLWTQRFPRVNPP